MNTKNDEEKRILVVDDHPNNLRVLTNTLNQAGYQTLIANSGDRALYQISNQPPDLILLDVMMPGIDGFETCRRLKANPDTAQIPVIFMTALNDIDNKIVGFEAGAVDYITKPFQIKEVLVRVDTHLTIARLQQQLEVQNAQLQEKNAELEAALDTVNLLSGMLPICANCKKIRDDTGYWEDVAVYVHEHSEVEFTHGICPDCIETLYPDIYDDKAD